jgi:outer membrane protein assembly factor BamB
MRTITQCIGLCAICLTSALSDVSATAADWRQFRGNAANSVADGESLPTELSGDTIAWKSPLPGRGLSGPIIVGDRVFVSSSSGYDQGRLHVICVDSKSGDQLWQRQFDATGRTMTHNKMSNATPTMASDGERVFAFFSSNDLICLDLSGKLQWFRGLGSEFPNASNSLGMSSSPIVIGSTVIVQVESDAEAFACGVDAVSGETKWQIERPRAANWTSPSVLPATDERPALALLQSSKGLTAVDPETGKIVWNFEKGASTIPSATVSNGAIVIPSNGLTAIRPAGDVFEEIWNASGMSPATSSPVVIDRFAFVMNSAGVLSAGDTKTGERVWQLRLRGSFSSTPIAAGGYLYAFNESGTAFVVKPDTDKGTIVSELDLAETILCSPGAANGALYVRSDKHLIKLAKQP